MDSMEPNSAGNENFSFDDIDIDYDLVSQLLHGDTIEAFASELTAKITNEIRDLGASGANYPAPPMAENRATSTNIDLLNSMEENVQNLAQPAGSSLFSPLSVTVQQSYPPIMHHENQTPVAGNNDVLSASSSVLGNHDIISTNIPDPSLANATTMPQPSFGIPVMGTPKPYCPIRPQTLQTSGNLHLQFLNPEGLLEPEILRESESFLAYGNSNQENLPSPYSAFDPLVGSSTNVDLIQQNGGVQSTFPSQPDGNWVNMNASNAQPQNPFQNDFLSPQWMAPVCIGPLAQNMASNNTIRSHIQQAPIYASQYPKTIMGTEIVNGKTSPWMNQQQPNWTPINNSPPYRPLLPSGPQHNHFMASNIIHPRSANSMLQGPWMPLRPQQFTNPNYQNHMVSNAYNPQGFNSNLPGPSFLSLGTPYVSHRTHGVLDFQYPNSSLPGPNSRLQSTSLTLPLHHRRRQPIQRMPRLHNSRGQLDQVRRMNLGGPIRIGPQQSSSIRPSSSSALPGYILRTQIPSSQGQIHNASVTVGLAEPHLENTVPTRQQAQESEEAMNGTRRNGKNPILDTSHDSLLNAALNQQNANVSAGPCRRRSRPESEDSESSSSSRRSKRKKLSTTQDKVFPADEGTSNAANAPKRRLFKNSGVYDPAFEKAGLWPDPHLRMLVMNWL